MPWSFTGDSPVYLQIVAVLRNRILRGGTPPGETLQAEPAQTEPDQTESAQTGFRQSGFPQTAKAGNRSRPVGYAPGTRLPSVRELAFEAAVNPNTMQRALTALEEEGLVYAESTAGRFVTSDGEAILRARMREAEKLISDFCGRAASLGLTEEELPSLLAGHLHHLKGEFHD